MTQKLDKSAKVISNMFSSLAPRYDLMNDIMTGFTHRYTRNFAVKLLKNKKINRVLDLASGTGDFSFLLNFNLNSNPLTIGCDFSKGMLSIAHYRQKILRLKYKNRNITFINSDISHLPFSNEAFEVCAIVYGLRNVQNPLWVLKEIYRVTKPTGHLIIVESLLPQNPKINRLLSFYFKKIVPKLASIFSSNIQAYDYYFTSVEQFITPSKTLNLLKRSKWNRVTNYNLLLGSVMVYHVFKSKRR